MKIYIDMDGVLADFEKEPNAVQRFATEKGFFKNLEPIYENPMLIDWYIKQGLDITVLSASPNGDADKDKIAWLKKYIPHLKQENIILCRPWETKADFVKDIKNSILVDDYWKNLYEWQKLGGKSIKYLNGLNTRNDKYENISFLNSLTKFLFE